MVLSGGAGNGGIFRFGEFAVAGTTQSSVVSVLRVMGFNSHAFVHPPPGFPLKLGSCHGTLK